MTTFCQLDTGLPGMTGAEGRKHTPAARAGTAIVGGTNSAQGRHDCHFRRRATARRGTRSPMARSRSPVFGTVTEAREATGANALSSSSPRPSQGSAPGGHRGGY